MNQDPDIAEKTERYLNGSMTGHERTAFEEQLAADAELRSMVHYASVAEQIVIGHEVLKLKQQMQKDLSPPRFNRGIAIAGFALLLATSTFFYFASDKKTDEDLAQAMETVGTKIIKNPEPVLSLPGSKSPSVKANRQSVNVTGSERTTERFPVTAANDPQKLSTPESHVSNPDPQEINTETTKKETQTEQANADPCRNFTGRLEIQTIPACKEENNGQIILHPGTLKGGKEPFTYILNSKAYKSSSIRHLYAGEYDLQILDATDCGLIHPEKVTVFEKECTSPAAYTYNPDYDQPWSIPYNKDKRAVSFKLSDRSGRILYQSHVQDFFPAEWAGESNTGLTTGTGYHLYEIGYADGSTDHGSVTIIR